jgi:hypothetical protein
MYLPHFGFFEYTFPMLLTTTAIGPPSNSERPSQAMALGYIGLPLLHGVQALGVGYVVVR